MELKKEIKLSEYLKMENSDFKWCGYNYEDRIARTKYFIDILGDITLNEDTYILFIGQFQSYGGRYDVRTDKDTFKGMYEIKEKYPTLTAKALSNIWHIYIKDLFDAYSLADILGEYIKLYNDEETVINKFIETVTKIANEYDKTFINYAYDLEEYTSLYDEDYIKYLKNIITDKHIPLEKVLECLPDNELIKKDYLQLNELIEKTRIYFGACKPLSYQLTKELIMGNNLEDYSDKFYYVINKEKKVEATFTKQDFLSSIKNRKKLNI